MTINSCVTFVAGELADLNSDESSSIRVLESIERLALHQYITHYIASIGRDYQRARPILNLREPAWLNTLQQTSDENNSPLPATNYAHIDRLEKAAKVIIMRALSLTSDVYPSLALDDCYAECCEDIQEMRYGLVERRLNLVRQFDAAREALRNVMINAGIGAVTIEEAKEAVEAIREHCASNLQQHA